MVKIYEMSEGEFWTGESLESVTLDYLNTSGLSREEVEVDGYPRELSDEDLDNCIYKEENGDERTFREELEANIRDGHTFPGFFAANENY